MMLLGMVIGRCDKTRTNIPPENVLATIMVNVNLGLRASLKEMATKNFIVSFERDSKTLNRSLLQNFYICFTSGDILT